MRILISLLCAMVLVGCQATTSGERPDIKSEAPTLPEPSQKPAGLIENAFTMNLPMMCAKSDEFMKAISNIGEKPVAIWRSLAGGGVETLGMMFVHSEKKESSIIGIVNIPPNDGLPEGAQVACMMSTGFDVDFYGKQVEEYLATPKVKKKEKIDNSRFQPVGEPQWPTAVGVQRYNIR
jgi:hypothetical protein